MPLVPGLQLPFGVQPVNPVAVDSWSGPYTGSPDTLQDAISSANAAIPSAVRFKTMEVRLVVGGVSRKFWYRDGILDTDLVEFVGGTGGYEGTDVYFYVSGSTDGTDRAVFGGDVVISGSLFDPNGLKYVTTEQDLLPGAVLFGGEAGSIAQNVAKVFWDNAEDRLGIGTSSPTATLTVSGSAHVTGSSYVTGSFFVEGWSRVEGTSSVLGILEVTGSANPGVDLTYDLGSSVKRWNNVYAGTGSFSGPVTIEGDLKVLGSQTLISSSVLDIGDNIVYLNSLSNPSRFGGLYVADQTTGQTGSLLWDSTTNTWIAGLKDQEVSLVSGSGTPNYVARWIGSNNIGTGAIYDNGTNVGIGTTASSNRLSVNGSVAVTGSIEPGLNDTHTLGSPTKKWANLISTSISGSLTTLADGTPYILAGSNITIVTGSMGEITISSTGGGGGGSGGTIGEAEDGTYEDGLFTDFTPDTPIGTPIDRFNEVLLALAPPPAPPLDNIDCDNSAGVTAYLSFGASNNQQSGPTPYYSSNTTAGFSAVDVNGSYAPATSGDNIRKGIYFGNTIINGDLNEDVPANVYNTGVTNYVANSFGNADQGTLRLFVNGSLVHSVDLTSPSTGAGNPGSGTASSLNANGSGFISLSKTAPAVQSNTVEFAPFKHRTGRFQVGTADQRRGWNYLRVVHQYGSIQKQTNYIEWINDPDNIALSPTLNSLVFQGAGSTFLSGVEYYTAGNLTYSVTVSNAYRYIYDLNPITFTASHSSLAASSLSYSFANQPKPTIDTSSGETHTKALNIVSNSSLTSDYFLNGSVTAGVNVTHPSPLKSSLVNQGTSTVSQILLYNLSNTSTNSTETFRRENYRLISGSYDTQSSVSDPLSVWDSQIEMLAASTLEYSDGLQFFNQRLVSPKNSLNGGNFSTLSNGPSGNPDYSVATGKRTFYRWFKNTTGSSQYDLSLTLNGSSTLIPAGTSLDASKIRVFVKIPEKTGWMDVSMPFVYGASLTDGSGIYIDNAYLDFDNTLNAINYLNFGSLTISNNEYLVLKIEADSSWTGNVSLISVTFGAGTGTLTPVPDLNEVDSDNSGITAKLSFGPSKSITGYTDSGTTAGFSVIDLNGIYQIASVGSNLRRGIFSTLQNMEGDLNESVTAASLSYVNNAFSDANTGVLKLEVNGTTIHTVDLSTSVGVGSPGAGTGTSLNANGSGFISLSEWAPSMFNNGVPRYTEFQRTARYRVTPTNQRNGWNYLRVIHTVVGVDRITNYVEWINDPDGNALTSSGNGLSIFGDDSFSYVSGVKYFNSPSGSIQTRISNIYKNVYSTSSTAITFASLSNATASRIVQNGTGITSTKTTNSTADSLQSLNTNVDSQNEALHVSGTINFTLTKSLPGSLTTAYGCGGAMTFLHPYKTSLTIPTQTTTNLLVWNPVDTSSLYIEERFDAEAFRLVADSYTTQAQITDPTRAWNSQISINDQTNYPKYATGLLVYDTYLVAPKKGGSNGDFRNHKEGGSIESPSGNVDYSSLTNSTRDYYRSFQNNTTGDQPRVKVILYGDATLVAKTGATAGVLGANKNIYVHVGIPGKTGLLDLARPADGANAVDDNGGLFGDLNSNITMAGTQNVCTFSGPTVNGTATAGGAQRIIVRVTAHKDWTGYLDRISIVWTG